MKMFSRKTTIVCAAAAALSLGGVSISQAADVVVGDFGQGGWYSSDTRDASGTNLFGANDTQPYLNTANGAVAGDDAKIEQQISFVDGPDGVNAVKLYATDQNAGKANLSVANTTTGFGGGSALLSDDFYVSYRSYNEPASSSRTLGISIGLTTGNTSTSYYTLSYVGTSTPTNTWLTNSADANSNWRLYGNGALGNGPGSSEEKSLADWAADATFGDIFTNDYFVYEVGFNLGSYQRNNNQYVDWFQSNLTNGGNRVNFVPEPSSLAVFVGLGGLALLSRRTRRKIA